jgi:hypothetical protein
MGIGSYQGLHSEAYGPPPHIIREVSFDEKLAKIAQNYSRLDELDIAIDWGLCRKPDAFFNIEKDFYLWKMERISDNFPQLIIVYHYDMAKNTVTLIDVDEIKDTK